MSKVFEISDYKKELLEKKGHLLVLGGPGSGKTTIALLKADKIISEGIKKYQKVLFLSFARATISRVENQAKGMISKEVYKNLEINTYHGFMWKLLKSNGYLLNSNYPLKLLTPPEAGARLAAFSGISDREKEKMRLLDQEGLIHFDHFATLSLELLVKSKKISSIINETYPYIILDEFQDTDQNEWELIKHLGSESTLIALADLEQRIYEFRGADPSRISQYIDTFDPDQYDFGKENNRSSGTDIIDFGNDLLSGENKKKEYENVNIAKYRYYKDLIHLPLKIETLNAIKRTSDRGRNKVWSVAILVPTKKLMTDVSDFLDNSQKSKNSTFNPISHRVNLEMSGPSLAAVVISGLLEQREEDALRQFIGALSEHIRGRNGNRPPSSQNLKLSEALLEFNETGYIRGKNRIALVGEAKEILKSVLSVKFTGEPGADWVQVRSLLQKASSPSLKLVGEDARYLRLLRKGTILSSGLGQLWRNNTSYKGAPSLISNALLQEHFSTSTVGWQGVNVMTMHAAKGKEFDEVIIYDGPNKFGDKLLKRDAKGNPTNKDQDVLALRVAVTRAMKRTTIMTPQWDSCPLI